MTDSRTRAFGSLTSRIGRRFVALFAGCALVPLLVFAWLVVTRTNDQMRGERANSLHNAAKTAGMGIAARFSQVAGDLALVRELARADGVDRDALATLQQHVGDRCGAAWILRGDEVTPLFGETGALPPLTPADREHLASGKPLVHAVGDPPELTMRRSIEPMRPEAGDVAVSIRSRWFWDRDELQTGGFAAGAFDEHWQPLFHTFGARPDMASFARAAATQRSSGTVEWTVGGAEHFARYWRAFLQPQYRFDLFVVQSHAQSQAFAVAREFTWVFAMTALSTLLVVVVIGLVQVRRTLEPIVELHAATARVAAGDLGASVRVVSHDELGDLGTAFNTMTARLQENIRQREQTERDLVASRDAALAAARAKAAFVTNVSHEFRTPMTELLSATEILGQFDGGDEETRVEFSGIALRGARRLARLIDEVVELGANSEWASQPVDVAASVRQALAAVAPLVGDRVQLEIAPGLPSVTGDGPRLRETWCRLLDNAVKFSPAGTPIEVRVTADGGQIVVEIADHGVGIAAVDLDRVFEPFEQVGRDQLTDKANGTGLGLTLAKNAVERHGGRIEIVSEVGKGSTFRVRLPIGAPALVAAG